MPTVPPSAPPAPPAAAWPAYRAALSRLGRHFGVPVDLPTHAPSHPDPVAAAVGRYLRVRRVAVSDHLSRRPRRPLLAAGVGDGMPVVVLPSRSGWRTDTAAPAGDGGSTSVAAQLGEQGWAFHLRLPHRTPTGLRLLGLLGRGNRGVLGLLLIAGTVTALLGFAVPVGAFFMVKAAAHQDSSAMYTTAAAVAGAVLASAVLLLVRDKASATLQSRVQDTVETAVWDRLLSLEVPFLRGRSTGQLAACAGAVSRLRSMFGAGTLEALLGALFTCAAVSALATADRWLGLAGLGLSAVFAGTLTALAWRQQVHDREVFDGVEGAQSVLYPALAGIEEVQLYGAEGFVHQRWWRMFEGQKRADAAGLRPAAVSAAVLSAAQPLTLAVLLPLALSHGTGFPGAVMVGFAAIQLTLALGHIQHVLEQLFAAGPVYQRLRAVLDATPETAPDARLPDRLSGELALENVTFAYDDHAPQLDGVSLHVSAGEFVAVVGPSGAGKTSLLRLCLGLESPRSGCVRYDGHDLAGLDLDALRGMVGYVPQDTRILRGSLRDVVLGSAATDDEDTAWAALAAAGLADDVRALPLGLDTRLSDGQTGFSGGQQQRLLLARALAKQPRVLLLDEATSALDNATQRDVSARVAALDVTRIVVAHRLSTIRHADRIVVLESGRIAETGRYDELLASGGAFARLVGGQLGSPPVAV
ncbi:ATP-binding cassette domain-containing protein [Streptomyces sp. NPDC052301]|uniref:ATP-binding cassette domain-containing protein n=1 Tax=Streptomyces sp. NPDC052301 TaxID=3365687 RepID=UPI0037CEF178